MGSTVVEVQLEWKYTPESYIEEPIRIKEEGFELSISDGVALARIEPSFHSQHPDIKEYLTGLIESRLLAVQIMSHGDFTLNKPSRSDLKRDGTKNIFLEVDPIVLKMSVGSIDFVVRDKNGNIVSDTKRDRLDKQKWFAKTVDKYRGVDSTLDQMLRSYQMAVKDPKNELVHLYEIRDALFGSALRDELKHSSDIDILVEFDKNHIPGLLDLAGMEIELAEMSGRKVDLRTPAELSRYFRDDVLEKARVEYAI